MIQIYNKDNTDYAKNGNGVITPSMADITSELNGAWSVALEHPLDSEERWKLIQEDSVLKMPSFNGEQLFRIKSKTKTDSKVAATAEPIFMDAMGDCFLVDIRPTEKTGQQALDLMVAPNGKYQGKSDITQKATAYYEYKNLIEAINGGDENSFINRWGGEIIFDNFTVIINKKIGQDRGVELRYGKNIPIDGMSEDVDLSAVVTRIYPKGYNGVTLSGDGYVDSPLIDKYPTVRTKVIVFDDVKMTTDAQEGDAENGIIICETQTQLDAALKTKCQEQYAAGADKPAVTITADMVLLAETEQYKDYAILEEVSLGDTIRCINNVLDIDTTARVVKLTYDAIEKKVKSVVIGDAEYNYFNNVSSAISRVDSAIRPDGTVIGGQIQGFIDGALAQLRAQRSIAKKQDVRAVFFEDTDPDSPAYGAMCLGTKGFEISDTRNADNTDWIWTTFGTGKGFYADKIITGILSDMLGKNSWNLNTGELQIKGGNLDFSFEKTFAGPYTQKDITRSQQIIVGAVTPTDADLERLDLNGDGVINSVDTLYLDRIVKGTLELPIKVIWHFKINSGDKSKIVQTTVEEPTGIVRECLTIGINEMKINHIKFVAANGSMRGYIGDANGNTPKIELYDTSGNRFFYVGPEAITYKGKSLI